MNPERQRLLQNLYRAFNAREFETILSMMRPDVKWANGMQGGFIDGRDAVREYWREQFEVTSSQLEPAEFETDESGRDIVTVHIVVRDLSGNVLAEQTVRQIFTIENDSIRLFEIDGGRPMNLMGTKTEA